MISSNLDKKDNNTNIDYFKEKVRKFIKERKWSKFHTPKNLIQAMNIELSELSELFLFKELENKDIFNNTKLFNNIKAEIADIFIYLISFLNVLDIDLTLAFNNKMKINEEKYSKEEFHDGRYYKK